MPAKKLIRVRLRLIVDAIFTKSEYTMFQEVIQKYHAKWKTFSPGDVILIKSKKGNQLIIVHGLDKFEIGKSTVEVLHTRRLRLTGGQSWSPVMLQNYAQMMGVHFDGIKTFEEHMVDLMKKAGLEDVYNQQKKQVGLESVKKTIKKMAGKRPKALKGASRAAA